MFSLLLLFRFLSSYLVIFSSNTRGYLHEASMHVEFILTFIRTQTSYSLNEVNAYKQSCLGPELKLECGVLGEGMKSKQKITIK